MKRLTCWLGIHASVIVLPNDRGRCAHCGLEGNYDAWSRILTAAPAPEAGGEP